MKIMVLSFCRFKLWLSIDTKIELLEDFFKVLPIQFFVINTSRKITSLEDFCFLFFWLAYRYTGYINKLSNNELISPRRLLDFF